MLRGDIVLAKKKISLAPTSSRGIKDREVEKGTKIIIVQPAEQNWPTVMVKVDREDEVYLARKDDLQ